MVLIERPDLVGAPAYAGNQQRVANVLALDSIIGGWTKRHTTEALSALLTEADIPSSKVYTAADIAADPQYLHRGMVRPVPDANLGADVLQAGVIPHMVETPGEIRWPGPAIGAHTDAVLGELAGYDEDLIAELRRENVI